MNTEITPELILRAFEITGLFPEANTCYEPKGPNGPFGCALGALVLAFERHSPGEPCNTMEAARKLGLGSLNGDNLASGFDTAMQGLAHPGTTFTRLHPLFDVGYAAGRRIRERGGP